MVRIEWIGIVCCPDAEGPCQPGRHFPGVLRVEIQIQEIVWLRVRERKCLRCGRSHAIDELRQSRVRHKGNDPLTEVIIIQPKDASIRSKTELMPAVRPGEVVINEEARRTPPLHPRVVQAADRSKRRVRAAALQDDRECRQGLLKIRWAEQAFVPGERRIEVVYELRGKDMRVARSE